MTATVLPSDDIINSDYYYYFIKYVDFRNYVTMNKIVFLVASS